MTKARVSVKWRVGFAVSVLITNVLDSNDCRRAQLTNLFYEGVMGSHCRGLNSAAEDLFDVLTVTLSYIHYKMLCAEVMIRNWRRKVLFDGWIKAFTAVSDDTETKIVIFLFRVIFPRLLNTSSNEIDL